MKPAVLKRKRDKFSLENSPLKRENRLSAVPTDQAGRTVARPHHKGYFKGELGIRQSNAANLPNQPLGQSPLKPEHKKQSNVMHLRSIRSLNRC